MKILLLVILSSGIGIMLWNVISTIINIYRLSLNTYDISEGRTIRYLCLSMMVFFLLGYIAVTANTYQQDTVTFAYIVVGLVFLFGAIFVSVMLFVQNKATADITKKTKELMDILVNLIEIKNVGRKGHSQAVKSVSMLIYDHLPDYIRSDINVAMLHDAALFHDIWLLGLPDDIRFKKKPTSEDQKLIKSYIPQTKSIFGDTYFANISDIITYSLERVDGKGYFGLKNNIPIESLIISIANEYIDRIQKGMGHVEAINGIKDEVGEKLDIELTSYFLAIPKEYLDAI